MEGRAFKFFFDFRPKAVSAASESNCYIKFMRPGNIIKSFTSDLLFSEYCKTLMP